MLYVAGWGRSGTTILDNLLGQVEGFVSTGELHYVWERGLRQGRDCGCGQPLRECETWTSTFASAFGGIEAIDPSAVVRLQDSARTRHALRALRAVRADRVTRTIPYARYLHRLYDGIGATTGARVIVDSSKYPTDGILAAGLEGYEVFVVHMVRDPRAVAFSWQRFKPTRDKKTDGGVLKRVGLVRSTMVWQVYNAVIARTVKAAVGDEHYQVLHYEQLASDPATVVDDLIRFVKEAPAAKPVFAGNEVELKVTHTASGNPGRFRTGTTAIRLDDEWRNSMPRWQRTIVTMLAFPMSVRLQYGG
ncbi:sulfotransferase domain-containing protein [Leekyejoonella antrihumi]|uniref:sulfotransferase domain-containing protein n=1 Tax=Leekyejoonella antrihumi TaxID=1660198 RepID=UPI001C97358E|nr:sulfotransferase domain-containing protein [Leekyejoonella antrihumi]